MPDTIWYTRCPVATCSGVALDQGMFDDEFERSGICVRNIRDFGADVLDTHFDHRLSDSVREGGAIPPIWARSGGSDTVLVGSTFVKDSIGFYVRADSPVESFYDLRGQRMSLPRRPNILIDFMRANTHHAFIAALEEHDMSTNEVEFVDNVIHDNMHDNINNISAQIGRNALFEAEVAALLRGDVDAIYAKNGLTSWIERHHADEVKKVYDLLDATDPKHIVNGNPRLITVSGNLAREAPDVVVRYLQVLIRAARWVSQNRHETARIWAKEIGVTVGDIYASYPNKFEVGLAPSLSNDRVQLIHVDIQFLSDNGYLIGPIDMTEWINRSFLQEAYVREDAISVV